MWLASETKIFVDEEGYQYDFVRTRESGKTIICQCKSDERINCKVVLTICDKKERRVGTHFGHEP